MLLYSLIALMCNNQPIVPMDIYGQATPVAVKDKWAYVSFNFGDFGHTVNVEAWAAGKRLNTLYYTYGFECPTSNSSKVEADHLYDSEAQTAIVGINAPDAADNTMVEVSVVSKVRPIAINSSMALIYGLFLFFTFNIFVATVLQYFFFKNSMDPREYLPQEEKEKEKEPEKEK